MAFWALTRSDEPRSTCIVIVCNAMPSHCAVAFLFPLKSFAAPPPSRDRLVLAYPPWPKLIGTPYTAWVSLSPLSVRLSSTPGTYCDTDELGAADVRVTV